MKLRMIDPDEVGGWMTLIIIAAVVICVAFYDFTLFLMLMAAVMTAVALFGIPYIVAYIWNRWIANE